jgi:hypothetical protein
LQRRNAAFPAPPMNDALGVRSTRVPKEGQLTNHVARLSKSRMTFASSRFASKAEIDKLGPRKISS